MSQVNYEEILAGFVNQYCFYNESYVVSLAKLTKVKVQDNFVSCFFEVIGNQKINYRLYSQNNLLDFEWLPQTHPRFQAGVNLDFGSVYTNGVNQIEMTAPYAGATKRMYFFSRYQLFKIIALLQTGEAVDNQKAMELFYDLKNRPV